MRGIGQECKTRWFVDGIKGTRVNDVSISLTDTGLRVSGPLISLIGQVFLRLFGSLGV